MGLFGYTLTKESELDKTAYAKVEAMEKRYKGYTEHIGVIHRYGKDKSQELTFDTMEKTDEGVKFYRYIGVTNSSKYGPRFKKEETETVPYDELESIHTIKREPKEMKYKEAVTRKKPVKEIKKGEKVLEVYYN